MSIYTETRLERLHRRGAAREQESRQIEESKARMATLHGLERNSKFDIAWRIAWDQGHSSGLSEVEGYFGELAALLKP